MTERDVAVGATDDGEPPQELGSGPAADPPRGRRESATDLGESLQREVVSRYERMSAEWSPRTQRRAGTLLGAVLSAMRVFTSSRLSGLAAEMAFWGIFALPWVVLGVVAGLSTFQAWFGLDVVGPARENLLQVASRFFNDTTMQTIIVPALTNIVDYGSSGLSIVSFIVALWSGSRVVYAAVEAVVIVSGQPYEGYVRTRARALLVYFAGLVGLLPVLVLLLVGPVVVGRVLDVGGRLVYLLCVLVLAGGLLSGLYVFAPQVRPPWRSVLPGALGATLGWVLVSVGLAVYVRISIASGSLYAVVGTPIALLLWAYLTAYVVLLGALLNRSLRRTATLDPAAPPPPDPAAPDA